MSNKPSDGMKTEASRGLAWRREFGRGGTEVGIARARDISGGKNLSDDTVKRMFSFFSRHEVDKQAKGFRPGEKGYPSNGRIAWALWGGDSGFSWSRRIAARLEKEARKLDVESALVLECAQHSGHNLQRPDLIETYNDHTKRQAMTEQAEIDEVRAEPDELSVSDFVRWNSSGGEAYGQIKSIERDGEINVPDSDFSVSGEADDPAALIEVYREGEEGFEASGVMVGHKFSTLTKTEERGYKKEKDRFDREKMLMRDIAFDGKVVDEKLRTVRIAVSSEEPVDRSFGKEILDHSERSIDMDFAKSGRMPLLLDHDPRQQIGVVENVDLDSSARRLRATVRFGRNGLARDVFEDVVDGIRSNISVGYQVDNMAKDGADSYRVDAWSPMEISVVSIPADRTVGVGRSTDKAPDLTKTYNDQNEGLISAKVKTMSEETTVDVAAIRQEAAAKASKDTAEMYRLAAKHQQRELADQFAQDGRSLSEFRGELLNAISNKPIEDTDIGLAPKEVRQFSLMRAIRAHANPTDRHAQRAAAFELEASAAAGDASGEASQGIRIPSEVLRNWALPMMHRTMNTSDDSGIIADDFRGGDFIDVLRNASSVMAAGATMLTGLSGNVKIPKKTGASTAGWIATEGANSSASEPTVGQVALTPKVLGAHTDITRLMMQQSSLDVEALVRNDLTASIATAIDLGALAGSGSSGQPTGIKNTSGINNPTNFAAAVPTFPEIIALETAVAEDNALLGNLAYILPPSMYGALKGAKKDAGSGEFIATNNELNGYSAIVSSQVTSGDLYFGNFSDLLIGMYGGLDIVVDPFTESKSGTVRIVALQTVDVAVRHAVSFAFNNDG